MKLYRSDEGDLLSDGDLNEYENGRVTATASRYTATGNEADIEDNVLPPSTPTPIMLSEMLRMKPPECLPTTPCRLASAREDFIKNSALRPPSTAERLTYRPKSAIETITDTLQRPKGAVPPLALPNWHSLPLENKIPRIRSPAGLLYYSPGKFCVQLHRKKKVFTINDPYNRETVVGNPYTALHDPHAKDFINKPETKRLLCKQGLINENDEVIFTLREFNKYRDYLRTVYSDDVHECVHGADELWKREQEQLKSIQQYLSQTEGKEEELRRKLERARNLTKQNQENTVARVFHQQQQTEIRLVAWAKERERINAVKVFRNCEKSRLQQERIKAMMEDRKRTTAQTYFQSVVKSLRCMEKRNQDAVMIKRVQESNLLEWLESKINQSKERTESHNRVNISCRENLRINAAKRQRRIEMYRKNLPSVIEKKKQIEMHRWNIAKKYFYIWLNKVRRRLLASFVDSDHESCWIRGVAGTLDETVKYLRLQTDTHERLDDFILSIIRLKNDIKRQIAEEDALEAAEELERLRHEKSQQDKIAELEQNEE